MVESKQDSKRRFRLALLRELAPEYAAKVEGLTGKELDEAISDKNVAAYIQQKVNLLKEDLSKAKEVFREYENLKFLTLYLGDYCASIEF